MVTSMAGGVALYICSEQFGIIYTMPTMLDYSRIIFYKVVAAITEKIFFASFMLRLFF